MWFQPGVFYLNFGKTVWTATGLKIIGGTPTGALPAAPFPGGCNPAGPGTQLVLGGASQIALAGGSTLDLCGLDTAEGATTVKLALVGLRSAVGGMANESGCVTKINSCAAVRGSSSATGAERHRHRLPPPRQARPPTGRRPLRDHRRARRPRDQRRAHVRGAGGDDRHGRPAPVRGHEVITATIAGSNWLGARVDLPAGANPTPSIASWVVEH